MANRTGFKYLGTNLRELGYSTNPDGYLAEDEQDSRSQWSKRHSSLTSAE